MGFFEKRRQTVNSGGEVDWAFAEALAFGTFVVDGTPVRLSGQDSGRGTFSQRHLILFDEMNGHEYLPLQHITPGQAKFHVYDSLLSEAAVLGFEFGYSVADPLTLVIWEAQFGDFANGAQTIIDQFISGAEAKWQQPVSLVMLLPHGYEGQGPEHSSARIERFLQLCAENNLQICNCTSAAQYFHLLRRQMRGGKGGTRHSQTLGHLHTQESVASPQSLFVSRRTCRWTFSGSGQCHGSTDQRKGHSGYHSQRQSLL